MPGPVVWGVGSSANGGSAAGVPTSCMGSESQGGAREWAMRSCGSWGSRSSRSASLCVLLPVQVEVWLGIGASSPDYLQPRKCLFECSNLGFANPRVD